MFRSVDRNSASHSKTEQTEVWQSQDRVRGKVSKADKQKHKNLCQTSKILIPIRKYSGSLHAVYFPVPNVKSPTFKFGTDIGQLFVYPLNFCLFTFTWKQMEIFCMLCKARITH